jgi:anti-sigma regulatory factor (Ser/Thr protein kinase)
MEPGMNAWSYTLRDVTLAADWAEWNFCRQHGRGVYLMKSLMDEVSFEERGNVLRMRKQIR